MPKPAIGSLEWTAEGPFARFTPELLKTIAACALVGVMTSCANQQPPPAASGPNEEDPATRLRDLASKRGSAEGGADAHSFALAMMKTARGSACMYGLKISLEILGQPSKADAEKHIQACEAVYAPLPEDSTPSRTRFFADARDFATKSNEAAEMALVTMKLYASAYAAEWQGVDLPTAAHKAWEMGCVDAARTRAGQSQMSEPLVGACAAEADHFHDAIEAAVAAAREP